MKEIHEIIRNHGGLRKLKENSIRIEKGLESALEIESIGKGPRGFDAIKVTEFVYKNESKIINHDYCFEVVRLINTRYTEEGFKYKRIVHFFPYSYSNQDSEKPELVFVLDEQGQEKPSDRKFIDQLLYRSKKWNCDLEDQGYLSIFKSNIQSAGVSE